MATKENISDRRILFVRQLSSKTTDDSLQEYFISKKCNLIACEIKNSANDNQKFGLVKFKDVKDIDQLMESRPHRIDGKIVLLQRKTPKVKLMSKEDHPVEYLRIFTAPQTLSENDIVDHFKHYGDIKEKWPSTEPNKYWIIKYDDYDSVDKVLLDEPHKINGCGLTVEKDYETATARAETPTNDLRQNPGEAMNVKIHERQHDINTPTTVNSIHIQNLPSQIDANDLSSIFKCPLDSIVMKPAPSGDNCSCKECWLIDTDGKRKSEEVADLWNMYQSDRNRIECNMQPITFELCSKFRNGECDRSDLDCDCEHQQCTAQGSCPFFCPFGHPQGSGKDGDMPPTTFSGYQVRIFGFNESMSSENLVKQLSIKKPQFQSPKDKEQIALIKGIRTYEYAKWILDKLKTCVPVGATWRYQIECAIYNRSNRSRSQANVPQMVPMNNLNNRRRSQSRRGVTRATGPPSDRNKSSREDVSMSANSKAQGNQRECSTGSIALSNRWTTPLLSRPSKPKKNSVEKLSSDLATRWTGDQYQSTNDSRIFHVSDKKCDFRLATIKVYDKTSVDLYKNECEILENLTKQGKLKNEIAHFIECGDNGNHFWIVMKRAAGLSLKAFLAFEKNRERCDLKKSIQLIQKLLTEIVKPLHEQQIYHENITPDHIMIDSNIQFSPTLQPQLKLISFSHAEAGRSSLEETGFFNRSTKDLSDICIILFWLLSRIDHQQNTDSLTDDNNKSLEMIEKVSQRVDSPKQAQLKAYLVDTFNRASDHSMYPPWTLIDLEVRLEAIQELIATKTVYQTPDAVFNELLSIRGNISSTKNSLSYINDRYQMAFEKAARIIQESKQDFIQKPINVYQWLDGSCVWVDVTHSSIIECRHDDILTYSHQQNRIVDRYSVIISFFGRLNKINDVMTLSIATTFKGKQLDIPIIYDKIDGDYEEHFKEIFPDQIKNLLIALLKEQRNLSASNQRI